MTTVVIFRTWLRDGGDVIALFPCEPGRADEPWTCDSYMHDGQHGAANPVAVMNATRAATPDEYAALKRELESPPYGYVLDVRLRAPKDASRLRARTLKRTTPCENCGGGY